jgi:hypothetical protein
MMVSGNLDRWLTTASRGWQRVVLLTAAGTLVGCMHASAKPPETLIAPGLGFAVPAARELGRSVEAVQLVTARYRDQTYVFEAHISVSPEGLSFIGLDPFGRRALSIRSSDAGTSAEAAPELPRALNPQNILADIAIVYWPAAAVRRGLAGSQAALQDDRAVRSITIEGREIVHIAYATDRIAAWNGLTRYRNIALGYELDIQSKAAAP